ncbi:MAG: hypothetical protein O3C21_19800 [Verrucomicrobia bacterium]|nr:hypothetical protein [Verrucomicrobiota bacterium]
MSLSDFESSLVFELQQLIEEMQSAQVVFSDAQARAKALIKQLSRDGDSEGAKADGSLDWEPPFDLDPDFEKLLQKEFSRAANVDHYIEKPFLDPYDCFDDSSPEHGFPFPNRLSRQGALQGLFESAPRVSGVGQESTRPDVEIEYLADGGYRMSSRPKNKAYSEGNSHSSDPLDGLAS